MRNLLIILFLVLNTFAKAQDGNFTDTVNFIKQESIEAGSLDFSVYLKDKAEELFLFDGVAYNKKDFSYFLWGQKVKHLGIRSAKLAIELREEIDKRLLTKPEKTSLTNGYNYIFKEE